jgi:error-prone DNA polymerase
MDGVMIDYATTGLSLQAHPLSFYRERLTARNIRSAQQLGETAHGKPVVVAGLVIMRQRPSTAKGITFVTLEDETGTINLVVRQAIWDRYYVVARRSPAWVAFGRLQRKYSVIHVVTDRLCDFARFLHQPGKAIAHHKSRDFR